MATEARLGLVRIASNYARLLATLLFGILLVPLLAGWLGGEALGLFLFFIAQAGLAAIFQDIMRTSLIRELASAWYDKRDFASTSASASLVCLVTGGLAVVAFALLWAIVPLLNMPGGEFVEAARWMLVFECTFTVIHILLAPAVNLYVVREWFVQHNIWIAIRRSDFLLSVLICRATIPDADVETGLITFAAIAAGYRTSIAVLSAIVMMIREPRVIPRPWRATRSGVRAIVGTFGWNTTTILATNLHDRVGAFIVNIFFGLWGNAVFGLATRLVSYIRMVTLGMTFGLDAVGARLATKSDAGESLKLMVRNATRMIAMMAAPAAIATAILAEPLLRLWIGRAMDDPDRFIDMSALLVQIMVLGLAARAVSDGWVFLLYGAGHISRYARIIVVGGILDPFFAIALVLMLPRLGEMDIVPWNAVAGPSWAVAVTFLIFHGVLLPLRGARILGVRRSLFFAPLVGPALLAGALTPLLFIVPLDRDEGWGLLGLAAQVAIYAGVYAVLAGVFLISRQERARIRGLLARMAGLAR